MRFLRFLYIKLYHLFWDIFLIKKKFDLQHDFFHTKNVFIYFDYEREFSGLNSKIRDEDISHLLKILGEYEIKTTWYTVGKIFEKYPESIIQIINSGHEVGSHTYSHLSPLESSRKELKIDFQKFNNCSKKFINAKGFHSPKGQWSINIFKHLNWYNFSYDVISSRKKGSILPIKIWRFNNKAIYRLQTVGDDWQLYNKNYSEIEVFNFLVMNYSKIKVGDIAGIGFHPWIIFSDLNILNGFILFLKFLQKQDDININSANFFVKQIEA